MPWYGVHFNDEQRQVTNIYINCNYADQIILDACQLVLCGMCSYCRVGLSRACPYWGNSKDIYAQLVPNNGCQDHEQEGSVDHAPQFATCT